MIDELKDRIENLSDVMEYREKAKKKSEFERAALAKDKTGVELKGLKAINPATGQEIPIWISDYVLMTYGTGAIMAVPGHDERDWEFAKKFGLPIVEVVAGGDVEKEAYTDTESGILVNSGFDGLEVADAKKKVTNWLETRLRPQQSELQTARLGVLPPALLGRANSPDSLREMRLGTSARRTAACAPARCRKLRTNRHWRITTG